MENRIPKRRHLAGIAVAIVTVLTTYLVHTNPSLNLADLTNTGPTGDLNDMIYMPSYEAGIGEEGLLEIRTKEDLPELDSITFSLHYTPVDALQFESNPIVFDVDTEFQDAAFNMSAQPEDGKLIVTIVLEDPITINPGIDPGNEATHKTLFKLNTQLNPNLPEGQVVNVSFEDFAVLNGIDPVLVPDMPTSTITIAGQNELKVLNAEAIDNTHVLVEFSDFLSDVGNTTAYDVCEDGKFDGISACDGGFGLNVNLVEPGNLHGYSQKFVVLTTDPQTAGQEYVITVDPASTIASNQQGSIDSGYSNVPFYGFGTGANTLSDFGMVSATVNGYKNINVVFTDDVQAASVTKNDFALAEQGGGAIAIDNVNSVNGNQVVLTVSTPLLKEKTYLLSAVAPNAISRSSDGAELGIDRVAFTGSKNGPRLIGATITNPGGVYKLQLTFDENIQHGGIVNNPVGRLYTTGTAAGTLINDGVIGAYKQVISGATLTLENAVFNAANKNFTFAVSAPTWLTNSDGVPVDDTFKSISFWGFGHDNNLNSVGSVTVDKKDAIIVGPGTLDFNQVVLTDVTLLYDNGGANLVTEPISSVGLAGNNLEVVTNNSLDPNRHYILRIVDNNIADNTLAAKDVAVKRELTVASAESIASQKVRVFFSENIDERDVDLTDFSINDGGVAVNGLTIDPGFQSVTLDTGAVLTPATVYKVTVTGISDVYSFEGDSVLRNSVFFTGYQTQAATSPVKLSTVNVVDAKTLRLNFTGNVSEADFTPVNLDIFWFPNPVDPEIRTDLVVTEINKVDSDTFELKTAVQASGENYFVIFKGVTDSNGLLLGNTAVQNFFGFTLPKASINLVTPSVTTNETETNVVISGSNLGTVQQVLVGNQPMTILSKTATSLTFSIPADFGADLYDITLIDQANNSFVFDSAILVTLPDQELVIHSEQSQAIPFSVPNDGVTKTKLWVLIEDPVGLSSISSVVVNLSQIGGPSTIEMVKDTGTQPQFSQWYTTEVTVPNTVATKDEPYLLPVEVRKGSEKFDGTVSIRVSKDVQMSVAPTIDNVYISPLSVPPDGETPVKISAQVSDLDGAATINSVVADLGSLGIGFKTLSPIGEVTEGTELETQFFESEEFTVPDTTALGTYSINVVASDVTGDQTTATLQLVVSTSVTGPTIDRDVSYVAPRKAIPRDGKTTFSIHAFVSDPDGVSDIQSVTATFSSIGIPPVVLQKDPEMTEGESAWYSATGLTIPTTSPLGAHDIEIRATDTDGGIANLILRIDVTHKDTVGEPPRVVDERSYTTPRVAINDGETPISLYVFVQDDDDDVESVVVNLSEVGQVGAETAGTLGGGDSEGEVSDGSCPTGSEVMVCMTPSVKEGSNGQWYFLSGVTVSKDTPASPNPYLVDVVVTDAGGKTTMGKLPIYVGSGDSLEDQQQPPRALAAVPTSETTIEVLFNKELLASTVLSSGKGFTISGDSDVNDRLFVVGATINPAGNVVTLSTQNQTPGKRYVLSVSSDIKDIGGRGVLEGAANRVAFTGFKPLDRAPVLEYIQATAADVVELEFRDLLRPTSVRTGISDTPAGNSFGIQIYESEDTSQQLGVLGVTLLPPGNIIEVKTERQKAEQRYRINIEGLASYDGTSLPVPINKGFKGFNAQIALHLAAAGLADLNGDGRVDFADFTIFSSVYGTVYYGEGMNLEEAAAQADAQAAAAEQQAGQPLQEQPDATVPITSQPAGGQVPQS